MTEAILFDSQVQFITKEGRLTDIAFIFLDSLWQRSGGYQDILDSIVLGGVSQVIITGSDYTTIGNQRVICTTAVTITLNASPNNGEVVDVKRTNGLVTIEGNGLLIDNDTQLILTEDFVGVQLYFSIVKSTWIIT
ncbi:MAG: hypothetical protein ACC707_03050 [Thiohalomonadales bacterium]